MKKLVVSLVAITTLITGLFTTAPAMAAVDPSCTVTYTVNGATITGTGAGDVICLDADNLIVNTLGGNDTVIDYGFGNLINLGDGNDTYTGDNGSGSDVSGGNGNDELIGTPGDDTLDGDSGNDEIVGGNGVDIISGGPGTDVLNGSAGNDSITGDADGDYIYGGDDSDFINGGDGNDAIVGGNPEGGGHDGDDTLRGGYGNDSLEGDAGRDNVFGEVGTDTIEGNEGDDVLAGGPDVDRIAELDSFGLNLCDYTTTETRTQTCIYDDTAPTLDQFSWDRSSYEVGSEDVPAVVSLTASDDQGVASIWLYCSGDNSFWPVNLTLKSNNGVWSVTGIGSPKITSSVGNAKSIRLSVALTIPNSTRPGTYACTMQVTDLLDHYAYVAARQLVITRANGEFDDEAPVLSNFYWDQNAYEVGAEAANPAFSFTLRDDTGVSSLWMYCNSNNGSSSPVRVSGNLNGSSWSIGGAEGTQKLYDQTLSAKNTSLRIETTIRQGFRPGNYNCYMYVSDNRGHWKYNNLPVLKITRAPGEYDDEAPAVSGFSWDAAVYDSGARSVPARATFTVSDVTGIKDFQIYCQHVSPNGNPVSYAVYNSNSNWGVYGVGSPAIISQSGDKKELTLSIESSINFGTFPGTLPCYFFGHDVYDQEITTRVADLTIARTPPGMPNAPTDLSFETIAGRPNEGILSWQPPSFLGDPVLKDYQIDYSTNGTDWKTLYKKEGKSTETSYRITGGLVAGTDYWFRVRGENGGGFLLGSFGSVWSSPLQTRTLDPAVPQAPTALVSKNVTKSSVQLSWNAPSYNGGALITNFIVETSRDDGATWVRLSDEQKPVSTSVNLKLDGLAPGTRYLVRVAAQNRAGLSEFLTLDEGFTTLTAPALKPRALTSSRVEGTSLSLAWQLPDSNGGLPISDYRVEFSSNAGATWQTISHAPSNERGFAVTNLAKGKTYKFRVAAVTAAGLGAYSDTLTIATLVSSASAPRNLVKKSITSSSVNLSWSTPLDNGRIGNLRLPNSIVTRRRNLDRNRTFPVIGEGLQHSRSRTWYDLYGYDCRR